MHKFAKHNGRIQLRMQLAQSCCALSYSIACFMCMPGSMTSCTAVTLRAFAIPNLVSTELVDAKLLCCTPCMLMHARLQKTERSLLLPEQAGSTLRLVWIILRFQAV